MTRRTDRVADEIQGAIAELLLREIKDPRVGMVTLTGVKLSPDLRHARVYFSVLGDRSQRDRSLAGLKSATSFIRARVARRLQLRVAPEVVFEFDPSLEQVERVARLLKDPPKEDSES
jgi:ribosome-binding factor A